jgi:hypothetical protein
LVIQSFSPSYASSAFDLCITDPLQSTKLQYAAVRKGYVGDLAEKGKLSSSLQPCRRVGIEFVPLVWESFGGAMARVLLFVEKVINFRCDRCPETVLGGDWIRHRMLVVHSQISLAIHDQVALEILKRLPPDAVSPSSSALGNLSDAFSEAFCSLSSPEVSSSLSSSLPSSSRRRNIVVDVSSLPSSPLFSSSSFPSAPTVHDGEAPRSIPFPNNSPSSSSSLAIIETMDDASSSSSQYDDDNDDVGVEEGFYSSSLPTLV